MKIAYVCFGHVDSALPLFKNLLNKQVDIDLILCFSLNRKSESILDFSDITITTGFTDLAKTEELLGLEIRNYFKDISRIHFFIFHNLKLRSFRNFYLSKILSERLKLYDIIHFNGTNGTLPFLICRLRKKRLIFTIHDIHSHSGERTKFNFAEKMNRLVLKSRYPLIVQNVPDFKKLQNEFYTIKNKFKYIPFGILEIYKEFEREDQKTNNSDLLFFGRISPYKGIEYLISAIEILNRGKIHPKTIIAGNGEMYFDNKKLNESGILIINRYIPTSELVSLIKNTKIVVCPYTDATQSGVAMTAFAFNKPVIASDVGSFLDLIKDGINGFLVQPKDADELASKISILLSNPKLIKNMSNNIDLLTTSGEYSWNQITEKFNRFYSEIYNENIAKQ